MAFRPMWLEATAGVLALGLAVVVLATGPARATNRRLALLLAFEGFAQSLSAAGTYAVGVGDADLRRAANGTFVVAFIGFTLAYPAFLATLDSPLVRPFRSRITVPVLLALGVAAAASSLFWPVPYWRTAGGTLERGGPFFLALFVTFWVIMLYALVVAASSWKRAAPGTVARRRATAYLAAFGVRDGLFAIFLAAMLVPWALYGIDPTRLAEALAGSVALSVLATLPGLATLLFVPLVAYGALRTRFLDLDLRIKVTIRQSTVAAVFVAVFVLVAAVVEQWAGSMGVLWGGVAAAALVFALQPIQRVAARVADAAMPGVKAPGEMTNAERLGVYRDQVQAAWSDGNLSKDERVLLERLRERLGIGTDEAHGIEREIIGA